jgi:hypothetical protein
LLGHRLVDKTIAVEILARNRNALLSVVNAFPLRRRRFRGWQNRATRGPII